MAEPFQFDWTTAVPVDDEPQPSAPSTPTPPESIDAVMSATPFGAQNMPQSQQGPVDVYGEFDWKTAEPLDGGFDPSSAREATPAEDAEFYEQINNTAYLPTKDEWRWRENFRKQRDDKVTRFIEGGKAMAGGLVQAAAATGFAPFDFLRRGTVAYDEWVNSSAEGVRQTGIATAELWSWAGDVIADRGKEIERNAALDAKLRQQLASENRFTGNAETDGQVFLQAREAAMASGFYDKTPEELTEDEDTQYQRFIRDRSFQQQAENITETNIGTLPDGRAEMGIDESKLNPGLVTTTQLIADPLNIAAGGLGIFSKVRPLRRAAALAGKPLELGGKAAGAAAQKADELYAGIVEGIEGATGLDGAQQMSALQNPITWKAAAAMGTLKGAGGILRTGQTWLDTGSVFVREAGTGGVGVARVEAASKLRTAPIPERYRRAYDGFFTSADSTLRRVSETLGLSPVARRSAATLDRIGATQAFRVADDAIGGALATTPIAVPLAAISPEERQPEMLGALMTVGAVGGVVGGKVRRVAESDDALVAKMLADVEISGGDATSMANMLSHDKLLRMAQMQTVMSAKADFVPLRANEYELNPTVTEHMGKNSRGFYVDATKGQRPRVFVNLDKLATGDVVGHEIGHAILKSDILGGQIKQGMRSVVDAQYGADGIASRGREYVKAQLTQEVNHKATGIEIEVLTPEESQRKAAGVSMDELVADRWKNDPTWRDQQISERVDLLNQEALAKGEISFDWARDEIVAETFSGLGKGINVAGLRASGPMGRTLGAMQTAMETMGARFTGSGRLESPNRLFTENPLFDTPQMRKAVNNYVKLYDRYLVGLEKEGKVKQRGRPIAPTGRPEEAARSPHTRTYDNNGVLESELFIERPDGTRVPKSQQMIDTQEKARSATLKSINNRTRFVDENSSEWGARKLSNGRIEVGGPTLPPQFDYFVQVPQWLRAKAREFEAGRAEGRSYLYSNNAIGTRGSGRYKIKNLGNVEAKTGEMVPFGWAISTENHLLVKNIDLNSFRAAAMRAIDRGQLGEFGNNLRTVEADLKQLMRNHEEGRPGETGLGVTKKNILNGLLGTGTVTQRLNNQAWHTLNNQGSIRTFRFDRLNYADQFDTGYFPHYQKININALPDDAGRMSLDDFMRFDADRQAAWLNKRARERGYTNSTNWANSDEAGFAAASDEYRKLFPRPDNNNRMPSALPQAGMAMPDGPVAGSRGMPDDALQWDAYTESLLDDVESWANARDTGRLDYDMQDVVQSFVDFARTNPQMTGGELTAAFYRAEKPTASQRKKLNAAIANVGEPPRVATGGARGQAMPDGSQPMRGQAMADVGSAADDPPRRLIDMPQSALKVLHANSAELPKPAKKLTNATVALTLADVAERHNNGIITSSNITPEQKSDLMILGADEAEAALKASGKNAGNWYSVAIEAALGIAGVIYRELSDAVAARSHAVLAKEADPVKAGQFALRLPLAITSQNMTVKLNTRASNEQFNIFLKTGKFDPSIAYGEKAKSISGNLDLANVMIDELGSVLALEDFVSRQFTVRELEIEASKIAGRSIKIAGRKDDIVNGAAIFGPKIGQGFLQNLMGKFDPVTIDLWMRRTWGRWTGDVVGDGVTAQRLARLVDQSRKSGRKLPDSIKRLRTTMRSMGETKTGKAKKPELTMSEDVEARLEADTAFRKEVEAFAKEVNAEFQGLYKLMSDVMSPALAKKVQDAIERAERLPDQADAILSDVYNAVVREQSRVKQQLDKKWSGLSLDEKREMAARRLPGWADVKPQDRAKFIKKSKLILKGDWLEMQHQAEGRTAKLGNPQKNLIKPAWANAAKSIVSELNPIDIPSDMDRRVITEVVNGIREELERRGHTVTNADVQAILWYPEKDLWAKLRGEEESILKQSYDDEFINIAEGLGLGLEARKVAKQIRGY